MHLRVMLRDIGKRYTKAYEVAEYVYFVMFFFGRDIMGHLTVLKTFSRSNNPILRGPIPGSKAILAIIVN